MKGPLEEGQERLNDAFFDVLADPAERRFYIGRFGSWPGLAKRYAEAEVGILIAFNRLPEWNLGEWVAVFKRAEVGEVHKVQEFPVGTEADALSDNQMQRPVLVEVVKNVEVLEGSPIFSTVRLHRLDETPRIWMDGSDSVVQFPSLGRSPMEDRELGVPLLPGGQATGMGDGKIVSEMVESGTEVEETFSDQRSPLDERRFPADVDDPATLLLFDVVLARDAVCVGVSKAAEAALKVLSVHVCPTELLADPWAYSVSHKGEE